MQVPVEIWFAFSVGCSMVSVFAAFAAGLTKKRDGETTFGACIRWAMFAFVFVPLVFAEALTLMLGVKLLFGGG